LDQKLHDIQQKLENIQEEEKEARETLKALQWNFAIVDGIVTQMLEE